MINYCKNVLDIRKCTSYLKSFRDLPVIFTLKLKQGCVNSLFYETL